MQEYIKIIDGVPIPYSLPLLRATLPGNFVFSGSPSPQQLAAFDVYRVAVEAKPDTTGSEVAELGDPTQDEEGGWLRKWVVSRKPDAELRKLVNAERDRRLAVSFPFQGKEYQSSPQDLARITGAATLAGFAAGRGANRGDLRWANGGQDFAWIAMDNTLTTMDAETAFAFGQAAAANESSHVFAARALKQSNPIPVDYADDEYWP